MAALVLPAFVNAPARIHADQFQGPIYGTIKLVELVKSITMREILDISNFNVLQILPHPCLLPIPGPAPILFPSTVCPSRWAG